MPNTIEPLNDQLLRRLTDQSTFVDIGAYVGDVASTYQKKANLNPSNCYLIEACPLNYNIICHKYPEFIETTYNVAITDRDEPVEFYIGDHPSLEGTSQANSLYKDFTFEKKWCKKKNAINIVGMALDSFIESAGIEHIDALKINCEGGEYKIFQSPTLDFLQRTVTIYLQLHGKSDIFMTEERIDEKLRIVRMIRNAGFTFIAGDREEDIPTMRNHVSQVWSRIPDGKHLHYPTGV